MSAFKQSMRKLGVRAGLLAGTSLAVMAIAGIGAGSASAACSSTVMKGQGSSLQRIAQQELWSTGYISGGCGSGTNLKPEYTSSSSGTGLGVWGFNGSGSVTTEWTYIGTDDGPNAGQIKKAQEASKSAGVVVVPVAQTAIAILVHPPTECTLEKITNVNLEKAFSGEAATWSEIGATGAGCSGAPGTLTRVVRKDASGTTYQFKNYLALINTLRNGGTEGAICTGKPKWSELEEIGPTGTPNTEWPECGTMAATVPTGTGGGEVAAKVAATAGTIGYAALPDAKAKGASTVQVQNNGISGSPIYQKPDIGTEEARCAKAEYTVPGEGLKASGTGVNVDWSKVFGGQPSIGGTTYPICTLTYDLGWNNYVTAGFAAGIGSSVKSYLSYIVTNGAATKWYQNLPEKTGESEVHNVKLAAQFAVEKVN